MRLLRWRTGLAAVATATAAVVGLSACDPVIGGLDPIAVSVTTDQTATRALERKGVDVSWLSCTARSDKSGTKGSASPTVRTVAEVDCQGQTDNGRKIHVYGKVTKEVNGRCVRGDLTAKVDNRTVFQANVLGNCGAQPSTRPTTQRPTTHRPTHRPDPRPTITRTVQPSKRPTHSEPPQPPPVTVTVTASADPKPTETCSPTATPGK